MSDDIYYFKYMGRELAMSWGRVVDDRREHLKKMKPEEMSMAVLCAIHNLLKSISVDTDLIEERLRDSSHIGKSLDRLNVVRHPVSVGMFKALTAIPNDLMIPDDDVLREEMKQGWLGSRGSTAIRKGGFKRVAELTVDNLLPIQGCGITTAFKIEDWAKDYAGRHRKWQREHLTKTQSDTMGKVGKDETTTNDGGDPLRGSVRPSKGLGGNKPDDSGGPR